MNDGLGIYVISEAHKKHLRCVLEASPELAEKWTRAKDLLKDSIFCDYLHLEIVIWGQRAGVAFGKIMRTKRADNRIKAYKTLYRLLLESVDYGKPLIQLEKSGDELFASMN